MGSGRDTVSRLLVDRTLGHLARSLRLLGYFTYCPACDRVTWPATHWEDMQRRLAEAGFHSRLTSAVE
jgi:uncharacterized protein with PIN domain